MPQEPERRRSTAWATPEEACLHQAVRPCATHDCEVVTLRINLDTRHRAAAQPIAQDRPQRDTLDTVHLERFSTRFHDHAHPLPVAKLWLLWLAKRRAAVPWRHVEVSKAVVVAHSKRQRDATLVMMAQAASVARARVAREQRGPLVQQRLEGHEERVLKVRQHERVPRVKRVCPLSRHRPRSCY